MTYFISHLVSIFAAPALAFTGESTIAPQASPGPIPSSLGAGQFAVYELAIFSAVLLAMYALERVGQKAPSQTSNGPSGQLKSPRILIAVGIAFMIPIFAASIGGLISDAASAATPMSIVKASFGLVTTCLAGFEVGGTACAASSFLNAWGTLMGLGFWLIGIVLYVTRTRRASGFSANIPPRPIHRKYVLLISSYLIVTAPAMAVLWGVLQNQWHWFRMVGVLNERSVQILVAEVSTYILLMVWGLAQPFRTVGPETIPENGRSGIVEIIAGILGIALSFAVYTYLVQRFTTYI